MHSQWQQQNPLWYGAPASTTCGSPQSAPRYWPPLILMTDGCSKGRHGAPRLPAVPRWAGGKIIFSEKLLVAGTPRCPRSCSFSPKRLLPFFSGWNNLLADFKSYHLPESLWVTPGLSGGISSDQYAQSVPYLVGRPWYLEFINHLMKVN